MSCNGMIQNDNDEGINENHHGTFTLMNDFYINLVLELLYRQGTSAALNTTHITFRH